MPTQQLAVAPLAPADLDLLERIADRAYAQMIAMIHIANNRKDKRPGDPKVGGHPAACASCFHILGALHLRVRQPQDFVACKPHASPVDHAYHHLMGLFRREDGTWLTEADAEAVMTRLRKFPERGAADVFQSYHAEGDPDSFHFLPSGTVGIPPVNSVFLALGHRYAEDHGYEVPKQAHFWSLIGDSEFREGSLFEAMPEAAERELGNVTWIIDYNRQNLDGTRNPNEAALGAKDNDRIERTALANGWKVIQLRHGRRRLAAFAEPGGTALQELIERELTDSEFQWLLYRKDAAEARQFLLARKPAARRLLESLADEDLLAVLFDLGGHDLELLTQALEASRGDHKVPYLLIVHTLKGFGLECAADPANHSTLPSEAEVRAILERNGLSLERPFARFDPASPEGRFLAQRGERFRQGQDELLDLRRKNRDAARQRIEDAGGVPANLALDMSNFPLVHTQQMWGQVAAKLIRIGTHGEGGDPIGGGGADKPLSEFEQRWRPAAEWFLTLSPDVGTSTNIAPTMNARIYGPTDEKRPMPRFEARHPELIASEKRHAHHLRFEIAEANAMSALGSLGKLGDYLGLPFAPVMTVYDFFIKRALDQLYYNLYWGSEFILIGTPSGATLSPEGAQHSWKSDIQIPNLVTWEPFFAVELEWILCDAIARQMEERNQGRSGVLVRCVTRAMGQKPLLELLRTQARYKAALPPGALLAPKGARWEGASDESSLAPKADAEILESVRRDCLAGAYTLIDWQGYQGYEPGDNVVHLFSMGSPTTEAIEACKSLLELGIFANLHVVTSPELLLGILGEKDGYRHLREGLGVTGDLQLVPAALPAGGAGAEADWISVSGRRVPIVAILDGEPGLLDNIGSVVGVKQLTLATRRFSKCGRPDQVYAYHGLDAKSIAEAAGRVLAETALESVQLSRGLLQALAGRAPEARPHWRELWPGASDAGAAH